MGERSNGFDPESLSDQGLDLTANLVTELNDLGRRFQEAAKLGRLPQASLSEPYVRAFAEIERRLVALESHR